MFSFSLRACSFDISILWSFLLRIFLNTCKSHCECYSYIALVFTYQTSTFRLLSRHFHIFLYIYLKIPHKQQGSTSISIQSNCIKLTTNQGHKVHLYTLNIHLLKSKIWVATEWPSIIYRVSSHTEHDNFSLISFLLAIIVTSTKNSKEVPGNRVMSHKI